MAGRPHLATKKSALPGEVFAAQGRNASPKQYLGEAETHSILGSSCDYSASACAAMNEQKGASKRHSRDRCPALAVRLCQYSQALGWRDVWLMSNIWSLMPKTIDGNPKKPAVTREHPPSLPLNSAMWPTGAAHRGQRGRERKLPDQDLNLD